MRHQNREIPAVRILPMSDQTEGFVGRSIEDVQVNLFLRELPRRRNGRYRYAKTGLKAEPGTVVLFQYRAHVIASAVFIRDEKFEQAAGDCQGVLHFEAESFRTFDPLDTDAMQKVWPWFKGFGHAKQSLNPALYPMFRRRLKHVVSPVLRKPIE